MAGAVAAGTVEQLAAFDVALGANVAGETGGAAFLAIGGNLVEDVRAEAGGERAGGGA